MTNKVNGGVILKFAWGHQKSVFSLKNEDVSFYQVNEAIDRYFLS